MKSMTEIEVRRRNPYRAVVMPVKTGIQTF
jgi:hypothetical protein